MDSLPLVSSSAKRTSMIMTPLLHATVNMEFGPDRPLPTRWCGTQAGVDFSAIWAWEVSMQEPKEYWAGVPDTYKQR